MGAHPGLVGPASREIGDLSTILKGCLPGVRPSEHSQVQFRGRAISPKAPSGLGDAGSGEPGLHGDVVSCGGLLQARRPHRAVRAPKAPMSAEPDRSEIGPYLRSPRATSGICPTNSASPVHLRGRAISPKAPRGGGTPGRGNRAYMVMSLAVAACCRPSGLTGRSGLRKRQCLRSRTARRSVPT